MNDTNLIEIKNLCKSYEGFKLKDFNMTLPKGFVMGFVGQNGAGKTTVIRNMLNMSTPDDGEILIFGKDVQKSPEIIKQDIGIVFDELMFPPHFTPNTINKTLKKFYSSWNEDKFFSLTGKFNLPKKKACGKFSKGMKMKLMIATALAHDPKLLILDEPTSGLDPVARDELLDIISDFVADENKGVLFSTHITADVERIADYVTVLNYGKTFYSGTKDKLLEKYLVIKGNEDDLPSNLKCKTIGFKNYRNGFEALLERKFKNQLPESIVREPANFDEILVFIAKEREKND